MTFRSNDHFQKKLSLKWTFGQMNFWSNDLVHNYFSVKWHFLSKVDSVKWQFSEKKIGHMNFRSYGVRLNGVSVEWTFGQMAFGQTVFGQIVFRSNGLTVKKFGEMIFRYTVIYFRPKLREFLRFPLNRNFVRNFEWIWCSEVSVVKNLGINTQSFISKNPRFRFKNSELP
jgi:hypothetical protein